MLKIFKDVEYVGVLISSLSPSFTHQFLQRIYEDLKMGLA